MEPIVIAGVSGKFPESANLQEFEENLFNGVDMVTEDNRRWMSSEFEMPKRQGKLKSLDKFDANFFGVHGKQANNMEPRTRMLLEITHEAIIDAGVNPTTLRGSRIGVFVGATGDEAIDIWSSCSNNPSGYLQTGCSSSMLANRISYAFDFQGPSMVIDTACSSSIFALHQAFVSMRSGICDAAIVAAAHTCLDPKNTLRYHNLGMLSPEGRCKSFDASANGFARSEAIVTLFICKAKEAKRIHATILNVGINSDGYKEQGITFPSGIMQEKLLRETYAKAGVDPADVSYIEAHGAGTKIGDPQEIKAIETVFCQRRDSEHPLLVGSVKSNIGHAEAASGLCGIIKTIISHIAGSIPGNLHFDTPNPEIPALLNGKIQVVSRNTPWNGHLVGVNNFGFGGTNGHVILEFPTKSTFRTESDFPLLIHCSGRTSTMVEQFFEKLMADQSIAKTSALLHEIYIKNIPNNTFRGYALLHQKKYNFEIREQISSKVPSIWFIFSGMGTQWNRMGQDLLALQVFKSSILKSEDILRSNGFMLGLSDHEDYGTRERGVVGITCIQIALFDLLASVSISPDGIIGHSAGELACAYADSCFTHEQTVLMSLARAKLIFNSDLPAGAMASIGITWDDAVRCCSQDVFPACHNSKDNC